MKNIEYFLVLHGLLASRNDINAAANNKDTRWLMDKTLELVNSLNDAIEKEKLNNSKKEQESLYWTENK